MVPTQILVVVMYVRIEQVCPTQMGYWAKKYVTILTRAAQWMAYFDLSELNLP